MKEGISMEEKSEEMLKISDEHLVMLTDFFKTLADPTRMKIIYALSQKEMCVQEIADAVEMTQTSISYQLRILRSMKLVRYEKKGQRVIYTLDDDHVSDIIHNTITHMEHN